MIVLALWLLMAIGSTVEPSVLFKMYFLLIPNVLQGSGRLTGNQDFGLVSCGTRVERAGWGCLMISVFEILMTGFNEFFKAFVHSWVIVLL